MRLGHEYPLGCVDSVNGLLLSRSVTAGHARHGMLSREVVGFVVFLALASWVPALVREAGFLRGDQPFTMADVPVLTALRQSAPRGGEGAQGALRESGEFATSTRM